MSGETTGICPQAPSRTSELIASGSGTCPGPGRWPSKESLLQVLCHQLHQTGGRILQMSLLGC